MNYPLHSHNESRDIEKLIEIKPVEIVSSLLFLITYTKELKNLFCLSFVFCSSRYVGLFDPQGLTEKDSN